MNGPNSQTTAFGDADQDPLAGDPELRKELAAMFQEDAPKQLAQIRAAVNNHDGSALKVAAHTLKGSIGVFKDLAAYEAALRMENIGRDADWPPAEDAWQNLNAEVARLLTVVAAFAGREAAPASGGSS
ncbi:MAG TPA: Hpt domain-containing protein [Pirellulales bacterium]|nr:Hpt domain-containing protein [Pirellulales bacterium]